MDVYKYVGDGWYKLPALIVFFCLGAANRPAKAIDYLWAAPVSGDPTVATNWSPNGVPSTTNDSAIFNLGSSGYTVSAPSATVVILNNLEVENDTVSFKSAPLITEINNLIVGNNTGDVGNLTVLLGSYYAGSGAVGNAIGSTGIVTVNGPNASSAYFGTASIGYAGTGTVNVLSGGAGAAYVGNLSGSLGTVIASGPKSTWSNSLDAYLGYGGTGSITIENGAKGSAYNQYIGYSSGSQGTLSVAGTGSNWTNSNTLFVGYGGTGEMDITAGATGKATAAQVYLGFQSGGSGTMKIDGAGSSFQLSSSLFVGESGTGMLSITNGGKLDTQAQPITIGDLTGSNGTLSIDGATSSLISTSNNLSSVGVGNSGTGSFSITGGAQVSLANLSVGYGAGGAGTVTVDGAGSSLSFPNYGLQLGNYSPTPSTASTSVTIKNGASLSAAQLNVGYPLGNPGTNTITFDGKGTTGTFAGTSNGEFNVFQGAVHVQNGAIVTARSTEIITFAPNTGNTGAIYVDGAGSSFNFPVGSNSQMYIGQYGGTGLLSVTGGGSVTIGTPGGLGFNLGYLYTGSQGTIDIEQGNVATYTLVNQGTLHVDGTLRATQVFSNGTISGTGNINSNVIFSGTIAPGDSPGTLNTGSVNWNAGGVLKISVNDANGTAGGTTGWGLLSISGIADLESLPHTISLVSLTAGNQPGVVSDFDPTHNYSWTILKVNESIQHVGGFNVDTSGFDNPLIGHFTVAATGNSLVLNYTVPEPSSYALAEVGMMAMGSLRLRRRAKHEKS